MSSQSDPSLGRLTAVLAWLTALVTPALLGWAFWVATGGH
jgi:hypothetical protein